MIVAPNVNYLNKIDSPFLGDEMSKIYIFLDPKMKVINDLLTVSAEEDIEVQNAKLNNLLLIMAIEDDMKNSIRPIFTNVIKRILSEIQMYQTLETNDAVINRKLLNLLSICLVASPTSIDNSYFTNLKVYFLNSVNSLKGKKDVNIDTTRSLIGLLHVLMLYDNESKIDTKLGTAIKSILLNMAETYSPDLNFKYAVCQKLNKNPSTGNMIYEGNSDFGIDSVLPVPNAIDIHNVFDREILSHCLVLYSSSKEMYKMYDSLWLNPYFKVFVLSLLKQNDINLKCGALNFLIYPYLNIEMTWKDTKTLKQFLPYLMNCFDIRDLPLWFDPFEKLIALLEIYNKHVPMANPVLGFLARVNMVNGFLNVFFQLLTLDTHTDNTLKTLTHLIRFCACCAAYDESYRFELLENEELIRKLQFSLEYHYKLAEEFVKNKDILKQIKEPFPTLFNSEIAIAWLQLLKVFSRSAAALRTTLRRNLITDLSLRLLKITFKITKECYFASTKLLDSEIKIMGLALGSLSNFIVEFSSVQNFLSEHGIVEICRDILTDPLFNSKQSWRNLTRKMAFEGINVSDVKTNTLWVLRHLMYNCQNQEKLNLLERIKISTILEFINDPSWLVQEQCFQVIRNLTCNSRKIVNILLEKFKNIEYVIDPANGKKTPVGSTYLFEFLARKMSLLDTHDTSQRKTLEAILYIIVNIAAVNENKKELVIEQGDILKIIHEMLSETPQNCKRYGNNSELKLAALWILHNLLWDSNVSEFTQFAMRDLVPELSRKDMFEPKGLASSEVRSSQPADTRLISPESNDNSNNSEDFVRPRDTQQLPTTSTTTIARCKRLVDLGLRDLVKQNVFDYNLNVKQKARSLLDLMDALLQISDE